MKTKEEKMEEMVKYFAKEFLYKNLDKFGAQHNQGPRTFDDMLGMFREMAEKANAKMSDFANGNFDGEQKDTKAPGYAGKAELLEKEVAFLKEQAELLKQQLRDKDEIIQLLRKQQKKQKKDA